ncbi:MAG: hypothetical protein R2708_07830 [Vicinamibacterales bacterium]
MRSEGNRLLEAIDETLTIAREADIRAEIYHLKASGEANWPKLDQAIAKIEAARASGLDITADIVPTRPAPPASMPRCRPGCRKAATRRGPNACATPRCAIGCGAR